MGGTHRAAKILGGNAPIHPPAVIARGQNIAESVENLGLDSLRQLVVPPRFADQAFGALAVAVGNEQAGERQAPPGARRIPGQKTAHGGGVAPVGPQRNFRAAAEEGDARPARIVANEGRIAAEFRTHVVGAQDHPFDKLLCHRVVDRFFHLGGLGRLVLAHQIERLLDRLDLVRRYQLQRFDNGRGGGVADRHDGPAMIIRLRPRGVVVLGMLPARFPPTFSSRYRRVLDVWRGRRPKAWRSCPPNCGLSACRRHRPNRACAPWRARPPR